jgi:hypothetical protein
MSTQPEFPRLALVPENRALIVDLMNVVDAYADTAHTQGIRSAWAQVARENAEFAILNRVYGNTSAAAELRRLHAANIDCVNHFNAIKAERDELLEALKDMLDNHEDACTGYGEGAADKARAAIARAEA